MPLRSILRSASAALVANMGWQAVRTISACGVALQKGLSA